MATNSITQIPLATNLAPLTSFHALVQCDLPQFDIQTTCPTHSIPQFMGMNHESTPWSNGVDHNIIPRSNDADHEASQSLCAALEIGTGMTNEKGAEPNDNIEEDCTNVCVENVDVDIDEELFRLKFSEFGSIISSTIDKDETGNSSGFGFVNYQNHDAAKRAVDAMNGIQLAGDKILYMARAHQKKDECTQFLLSRKNYKAKNRQAETLVTNETKDDNELNGMSEENEYIPAHEKSERTELNDVPNENLAEENQADVENVMTGENQVDVMNEQSGENGADVANNDPYIKDANLYIKNLGKQIDDAILHAQFSQCGTIISAKVMCNDHGVSRGFGFVCYSSSEEAQKAIAKFNRQFFYGKPLYVALAEKKEDRKARIQQQFANISSSYATSSASVSSTSATSSAFVPSTSATSNAFVPSSSATSNAFVSFTSSIYYVPPHMNFALQVPYNYDNTFAQHCTNSMMYQELNSPMARTMSSPQFQNNMLSPRNYMSSPRFQNNMHTPRNYRTYGNKWNQDANVYVRNLHRQVDNTILHNYLSQFGTITSSKVMDNEFGVSRGFGFVCYSSIEEAQKAISALNGQFLFGNSLYVAPAKRKENQNVRLEQCSQNRVISY